MGVKIMPSDLKYRYPKDVGNREKPKFGGKPDPQPFNRDDIYEIVPMMEAAMDELGSVDGRILHLLEDIMNENLPRFIVRRDEVFDFLVGSAREMLKD